MPSTVISAGGDVYESYKTMARDTKRDEQEGAVIPSDCWDGGKGKPMYEMMLLSTGGPTPAGCGRLVCHRRGCGVVAATADRLISRGAGRSFICPMSLILHRGTDNSATVRCR